ncbi:MAG: rhomboid family intramembrane serine protease, partial [archaeon]|nr:rhomboid family intramembrane serine protease [archaeon]
YLFIHGDWLHILLNMFMLWVCGQDLETEWGKKDFFLFYFLCGVGAGVITVLFDLHSNMPIVGASGAIFGLMAYLTLMRPFKISPMPFLIPLPIALAAVLYTVATIPLFLSGNVSGGISHSAHIGGLLGGSLMAFGLNYIEARKGLLIVLALLVLVMMMPVLVF